MKGGLENLIFEERKDNKLKIIPGTPYEKDEIDKLKKFIGIPYKQNKIEIIPDKKYKKDEIGINKIKIIPGSQYKKDLLLNDIDNYFNIDNIYSKNYDLFYYINNEYIDDIVKELTKIKNGKTKKNDKIFSIINKINILNSRYKSRSISKSRSKSRSRSKISGGSNLSDKGVKFLKCLNIFDAKHDFTKKDNIASKLNQYINYIGNRTIENIYNPNQNDIDLFKGLFLNDLGNYEYNILKYIIDNIGDLFINNINLSNFSFIKIQNDIISSVIGTNTVDLDSNTNEQLIKYIKNFFNYKKISSNDCKYIFDTSLKINKDLNKIIKDNIFEDNDDNDDDDNNDDDTSNPSIRINLYNKIGNHIKPFENAFDPHSSNEIIIDNAFTYDIYTRILNENFNYVIPTPQTLIQDENYAIKTITRNNFTFHIYPSVFIPNTLYLPSIKLIKINDNDSVIYLISLIDKYLDSIYQVDYKSFFEIKIKNSNDYLIRNQDGLLIKYDKSFNSINNLKETIKKLVEINPSSSRQEQINYIDNIIRNQKFCNNNVLNILTTYLIISETNNFLNDNILDNIYNVINILLDLKKAGDWGQSIFCSNLNIKNSNNNCFFISGDQLSSVRSILFSNVNTIFSIKNDLGLFKANSINTFTDFHNFLKENIYNHEIFRNIFLLYENIINNELFFSNEIPGIQPNTYIDATNLNFTKLNTLLLILFFISKIYLCYNSVIRFDGDTLIKFDNYQKPYIDNYVNFFNKINDSNNFMNLNYLFELNYNPAQMLEFLKVNFRIYLNDITYSKILNSFTDDFNNIIPNPLINDIYIYINLFLNFIDVINIYNTLICYDRTQIISEPSFNTIIKNKQIYYSRRICDLLSKLEFINYNSYSESIEYTQLEYYENQKNYYRKSIDELEKFRIKLSKLNYYITTPNFTFNISYDNFIYSPNNDELMAIYNNYKYKLINDYISNIDIWKKNSDYKEIIKFFVNSGENDSTQKNKEVKITYDELFYNIIDNDEKTFKSNLTNYNLNKFIKFINNSDVNILLNKCFNEIIILLNNDNINEYEKSILKKIFINIVNNTFIYTANTKIPNKIINIHNEFIAPEIVYRDYYNVPSKKDIVINLLKDLYLFDIKKIKLKNIENDFLDINKFKIALDIKYEDYYKHINIIDKLINETKFKNYTNMILIYLNNNIELLNKRFDIREIYNKIYADYFVNNYNIYLLKSFNYFIFFNYLKKYKKDVIKANSQIINFDDLFDNDNVNNIFIYNYININNATDEIIIDFKTIFNFFKEFKSMIEKNKKVDYNIHIQYFCILYENIFKNSFNLENLNNILYEKSSDYGYRKENFMFLKKFLENRISQPVNDQNEANFIAINRRDRKDYIKTGTYFLLDGYKTLMFNKNYMKSSMSGKDLFKYISVNSFIIKDLLDILNSSTDNIFDLFKKTYSKYDNMKIKEIAIKYYKIDEEEEFKNYIFEIMYIFLKGVVSFYDRMINMKKSSNDLNVKLYNSSTSKDLKNILAKFDYMIKYTTSNSYSNLPTVDFTLFQDLN